MDRVCLDRSGLDKGGLDKLDQRPLDGQRGVLIGLGTQPLLLELFGTHTLFRRHYRQLIESTLLDLELLPSIVLASGPVPGQRARDFAGLVQRLISTDLVSTGSTGWMGRVSTSSTTGKSSTSGIRSTPFTRTAGQTATAGIAVELPQRQPVLAHLTTWNTQHPLMELA